jgi:phytoene dehydrogenase-like protein
MARAWDAIVVGAGHNGLVCAAYLARAGRRVLVLERRERVGGAAVTEEVFPGFRFSVYSYVVSLLRPEIVRELDLPRHGLHIVPLESTFTPLPGGDYLAQWNDPDRNRREIARHSPRDAEAVEEFGRWMHRMARAVRPLLATIPPDPASLGLRDLSGMLRLVRHLRAIGRSDLHELHRLLTMSAADFLDRWFECEPLKATKSASGIIGTLAGPRSPGTAYVLLHHYIGELDGVFRAWGIARGGNGAVSEAIAAAARAAGAEIRTAAPVGRVLVERGRAVGVVLESGEEIRARALASNADPRHTFLDLVGEAHLEPGFAAAVRRYRYRGASAKVNLALAELPDFTALPGAGAHLRGAISVSPSVAYLERAYDEAKYGAFSRRPYLDIVIPTLIDPTMAPPGRHVMSVFAQYAPRHIEGGWTEAQRAAFGDTVVETLAEYAPNLPRAILGRQVLTPEDIERTLGLAEGNIFQGELSVAQMFFLRPVPGASAYRTPVPGLWLCGSGAHPGGGVMGAAGRNAALRMLREGV